MTDEQFDWLMSLSEAKNKQEAKETLLSDPDFKEIPIEQIDKILAKYYPET